MRSCRPQLLSWPVNGAAGSWRNTREIDGHTWSIPSADFHFTEWCLGFRSTRAGPRGATGSACRPSRDKARKIAELVAPGLIESLHFSRQYLWPSSARPVWTMPPMRLGLHIDALHSWIERRVGFGPRRLRPNTRTARIADRHRHQERSNLRRCRCSCDATMSISRWRIGCLARDWFPGTLSCPYELIKLLLRYRNGRPLMVSSALFVKPHGETASLASSTLGYVSCAQI